MANVVRTCRCVSLHTYPAYVTADSWHVVIHICDCGREHLNDVIPPPASVKRRRSTPTKRRKRRG